MHESDEHDIFYGGGASGAVNRYEADDLSLTTVGIDVGSSTFHFIFTAVHLHRDATSGQFRNVGREVIWRSPVYLTPYREDRIDAEAIAIALDLGHRAARIPPDHVDGGAVILTGDALRSDNARAIGDALSLKAGTFVNVSAGHHLESLLAAFGSGAVGLARDHRESLLHVDIGGGTTKFAFIDSSGVRQTAAICGGGRTIAFDAAGRVTRLGTGARALANHAGVAVEVGEPLSPSALGAIAAAIAEAIAGVINGVVVGTAEPNLRLTPVLDRHLRPDAISFSGGVSEYLYGREQRSFGDIGPEVAAALRVRLSDGHITLPLIDPGEGIRATVIGAAQSTVQMSGNSIRPAADGFLPVRDVVVVHPRLDSCRGPSEVLEATRAALLIHGVTETDPVALSYSLHGQDEERFLEALATGIGKLVAARPDAPTLVLLDDASGIAALENQVLRATADATPVLFLHVPHLSSLDYLDVGKRIDPAGVVPVTIKSLLFDTHHHQHVDHEHPDQTGRAHSAADRH